MSLRNVRSFIILLLLELAAFEFQVNAFSIRRSLDGSVPELDSTAYIGLNLKRHSRSTGIISNSTTKTENNDTTVKTEQKNLNLTSSNHTTVTTESTVLNKRTTERPKVNTTEEKILSHNSSTVESKREYPKDINELKNINELKAKEKTKKVHETTLPTTLAYNGTTEAVKDKRKTEVSNNSSYSTEPVMKNQTVVVDKSSSLNTDGTGQNKTSSEVTTTTEPQSRITSQATPDVKLPEIQPKPESAKDNNKVNKTTETLAGDHSAVTVIPYWKKYTAIERKRTSNNKTEGHNNTSAEKDDLIQSGTAQSSVSLENAFSVVSDIPSLQELKNELLAKNKTQSSVTKNKYQKSSTTATNTPVTLSKRNETEIVITTETIKKDTLTSKRAGFLDFSSRPTVEPKREPVKKTEKKPSIPVPVENITTSAVTSSDIINNSSKILQSQLAEDAIEEELAKEELLSDSVESQSRQGGDTFGSKVLTGVVTPESVTTDSYEDKLSVRPISAEKFKNGGLYTVNPNYKRLKKIEVQPPKPFVRNPDDNSWRNESLSSLGIVFKANNSSKPFTEVLKNKTETEWNGLLDKYNKDNEPRELRERLEHIAEKRKLKKKKKINQFGETVYEYEDSTSEESGSSAKPEEVSATTGRETDTTITFTTPETDTTSQMEINRLTTKTLKGITFKMDDFLQSAITKQAQNEYEQEDDEQDYTLPNIDLKKFIKTLPTVSLTSPPTPRTYPPGRRPTVQYFPPRENQESVILNEYDSGFQKKINAYTSTAHTRKTTPKMVTIPSQTTNLLPEIQSEFLVKQNDNTRQQPAVSNKMYLSRPEPPQQNEYTLVDQDGFNRASYVIKHLRDIIEDVAKDDEPGSINTEEPLRGITYNNIPNRGKPADVTDYEDYETQFKKDVLERFVENFNQNSERFKADFPILYNSSVVHSTMEEGGRPASSTAFMKRLYEDTRLLQQAGQGPKGVDVQCERTVELSPSYELHYYVPDEEEKEPVEQKARTISYRL